jgi:hypothetical protein
MFPLELNMHDILIAAWSNIGIFDKEQRSFLIISRAGGKIELMSKDFKKNFRPNRPTQQLSRLNFVFSIELLRLRYIFSTSLFVAWIHSPFS